MRLMKRDTVKIPVYESAEKPGGYIGTVTELKHTRDITGIAKPVTDTVSLELYGDRVKGMLTVLTASPLSVREILKIDEAYYKVLSVARYTEHYSVLCERSDKNAGAD